MTYPGNSALDPDIRERVTDTFRHSLDRAEQGNLEEARLGCDFIMRLDPEFSPAEELAARLDSAEGPVEVADLRGSAESGADGTAPDETGVDVPDESEFSFDFDDDDLDDLGGLDVDDLPDVEETDFEGPAGGDAVDLRSEFEELLAARRFDDLVERSHEHESAVAEDPELRRLAATAAERREAEPYVLDFIDKAREARDRGEWEEIEALLDKAAELDPTHPRIEAFRQGEPGPSAEDDEPAPELGFAIDEGGEEEPAFEDELDIGDEQLDLGEVADSGAAPPTESAEGGDRIDLLLEEGQQEFDDGEYQAAIDAWSRIFLIDIDHEEAARRIDEARTRRAEQARELEEAYHEAVAMAEAGETEEAKRAFERILEREADHLAAREALERLERGEEVSATAVEESETLDDEVLLPTVEIPDETEEPDLAPEVATPPVPPEEEPRTRPSESGGAVSAAVERTGGRARPTFWIVAAAALVVVAGVAWFVLDRWESLFPNTDQVVASGTEATAAVSPIDRAQAAYDRGERAAAVAQLEAVPEVSPHHDEASALLEEWRIAAGETASTQRVEETVQGSERREELLARGREAVAAGRSIAAVKHLEQAAELSPLQPEDARRLAAARQDISELEDELELVRAGEYDRVMRDLWLLREENPDDPDVREMLATAYYNLGVRDLQQGNFGDAEENLTESRNLGIDDPQARRLVAMAQTYGERSEDLLYRIFVKYLEPRTI